MILKTVNNQGVETFQDLGNRFNVVSKQRAEKNFEVLLNDNFGKFLPISERVYAIISTYTPGVDDIALYDDDCNMLYTNDGEQFSKFTPPASKEVNNDSNTHTDVEKWQVDKVGEMCEQSLSPSDFEMWDKIKYTLLKARNLI